MRFTILALAMMMAFPAFAEDAARRITVTGTGRVDAAPDLATISLGVTSDAVTAAAAMAATNSAAAMVLAQLEKSGIEPRDMQTSGVSLQPRWDNRTYENGQPPTVVGFVASNMITVRVRALDSLGSVLDAVVQDGANMFQGLSFGLQEPAMDEARKRAVADAQRKAVLFATAAKVTLGDVISIDEQGGYAQPKMMMEASMMRDSGGVPVAQGEVSVEANVTVVFALIE
ncbi:SIMPL domain-containing protein [Pseudogemmobacter sp. W21_MBD1_M6]|uniref:SIMPL domain-containing protein n=1 Tax=Pseudogemmobacter sp. W21_MBD1_M6 TaxID=3240271 RepID=UPI003F94D0C7